MPEGDSISTYWGSAPEEYKVFYDGENCIRAGLYTVEDTWWMRVIRELGGDFLVNNSYSGSKVSGNGIYSGNSDYRLYNLHRGCDSPDVILVALGTDDYRSGVPTEPETGELVTGDNFQNYFRTSYQMMLWKLRQAYPEARIYCSTLCYGTWEQSTSNPFPKGLYGIPLSDYNRMIRECAAEYGCHVADLEKCQGYYESMDGVHPNAEGMLQLAQGWIKSLEAPERTGYLFEEDKKKEWIPAVSCGVGSVLLAALVLAAALLI